jgi:methylenetetrahydrofolate reductase (NADPH)
MYSYPTLFHRRTIIKNGNTLEEVLIMKISDALKVKNSSLSFEFFPPKDEAGINQLLVNVKELEKLKPTFVSLTYGAGGGTLKNTQETIVRIKNETALSPMPHLTCVDQNNQELKNILKDYSELGIENILALRGDPPKGSVKFVTPEDGYCYARDLVKVVASFGGFSIGVAAYPEGHPESPNLEMDILHTREKIDAGADFAITQMFFDNRFYYDLLERADKAGIRVPIIPGIMPITDTGRIQKFCQQCGATLPEQIISRLDNVSSPEETKKVGLDIVIEQCSDLLKHGIHYFHFFTLNKTAEVTTIVTTLGLDKLGL